MYVYSVQQFFQLIRAQNCDLLVASATKNWALATAVLRPGHQQQLLLSNFMFQWDTR